QHSVARLDAVLAAEREHGLAPVAELDDELDGAGPGALPEHVAQAVEVLAPVALLAHPDAHLLGLGAGGVGEGGGLVEEERGIPGARGVFAVIALVGLGEADLAGDQHRLVAREHVGVGLDLRLAYLDLDAAALVLEHEEGHLAPAALEDLLPVALDHAA